jgi:hypothetical protein
MSLSSHNQPDRKPEPTASALAWSPLPRLHLFEFHERDWFPGSLRNAITEILRVLGVQLRIHEVIAPVLERVLEESKSDRIIDLCSGAGGPILAIQQQFERSNRRISVLLTDKFPNREALRIAERVSCGLAKGLETPIDATRVPEDLCGVRTLFNAFHHFKPEGARGILQDAFQSRQPIAIFESTERSLFNTFSNFALSFLTMLVLMPRMRAKRLDWWFFTYLVPLLPAAFGWDGFVSCLRSYTASEFALLIEGLTDESYAWSSGRLPVPRSPTHINYFVGMPVTKGTAWRRAVQGP